MKRNAPVIALGIAFLATFAQACGPEETGEAEVPQMLRVQFETQMKTVLHDLKVAQEQAMAFDGTYLELPELQRKYFTRVVPDNYSLTLTEVSGTGFKAQMSHTASGLTCRLEVGESGAGIPRCD